MDERVKNLKIFGVWCAIVVWLSAFFLTVFGIINIKLDEQKEINKALNMIINIMLFHANIYVVIFVGNRYTKSKTIALTAMYIPIYLVSTTIPIEYGFISTMILPFLFVIMINIVNKKIICKNMLYWILIIIYQAASGVIKIEGFGINQYELNAISNLILSIDLFLFYKYLVKVGEINGQLVGKFVLVSEKANMQQHYPNGIQRESKSVSIQRRKMPCIKWNMLQKQKKSKKK